MSGKRALVLFAGCGGSTLGAIRAGYTTTGVDNWPLACQTHEANGFSTVRADLTAVQVPKTHRGIDLLWSSFPCQGFSALASYKESATPEGVRATIRAVERTMPRLVITENVQGLKAPRHKDHFVELLGGLVALGYRVQWRVLDCSHYGLPQKRKRLFVIARRDSEPVWPNPTTEHNPCSMAEALGWPEGVMIQRRQKQGPAHNRVKVPDASADLPAPTVTTQTTNQWIAVAGEKEWRMTVRDSAILQGFPEDFIFLGGRSDQGKQVGNAVPPMMAQLLIEENSDEHAEDPAP